MFRAIFSLIIKSIKLYLQPPVLHTYVAARWYHASFGTAVPTLLRFQPCVIPEAVNTV